MNLTRCGSAVVPERIYVAMPDRHIYEGVDFGYVRDARRPARASDSDERRAPYVEDRTYGSPMSR